MVGHLSPAKLGIQDEVQVLSSIKEYLLGPQTPGSISLTLGLPSRGTTLYDLIHLGPPFEHIDQVASLLLVKREIISTAIGISSTTIARRAKAGRFNVVESDRLIALIAVFEEALSLFEGDAAAARDWMRWPVRGLGSRCPINMLGARVEMKAVLDLIGRLERRAPA